MHVKLLICAFPDILVLLPFLQPFMTRQQFKPRAVHANTGALCARIAVHHRRGGCPGLCPGVCRQRSGPPCWSGWSAQEQEHQFPEAPAPADMHQLSSAFDDESQQSPSPDMPVCYLVVSQCETWTLRFDGLFSIEPV